mgnify:CR=1 FL=1
MTSRGVQVFFRYVSDAEYLDWGSCGRLRPGPNSLEFGKHMATTVPNAQAWGRQLERSSTLEGRVLTISFPTLDIEGLECLGPNIDNIGPAWFACHAALKSATVVVWEE